MPMNIIVTEGILSESAEQSVFAALTDLFLKQHNLTGNGFMTPNTIGEFTIVPKGKSYAGGKPANIAIVELRVPSFALESAEQKQAFITEATEIVLKAANGKLPKDHIWVNMVYAVDGLWGIAGKAYSNAELGEAISKAGKTCATTCAA